MIFHKWSCEFEEFHDLLIGGRTLRLFRDGDMIWAEDVIPNQAEGETFKDMKADAVRKVYRHLLEMKANYEAQATHMRITLD